MKYILGLLLLPTLACAEGYYYPLPSNPQPLQLVLPPAYIVPPQQQYAPPPVYIQPPPQVTPGTPPRFEHFDTGRVYERRER